MNPAAPGSPEFGGECAFAVSLGKRAMGKERCFEIRNGKKYLFLNPVARILWRVLPGRVRAAERHWSERARAAGHS